MAFVHCRAVLRSNSESIDPDVPSFLLNCLLFNDDEVRASLVVAAERQAIPSCDILTVWKEFKHPRHEEFAEPTRWSLLNAFTETAKKYSPARADQCYRSLTRLFGLDGKPAELEK